MGVGKGVELAWVWYVNELFFANSQRSRGSPRNILVYRMFTEPTAAKVGT